MEIRVLPVGLYGENTYVIRNEGHVVIVDPGGHPEIIMQQITDDDHLEAIVLTHGHEDHVGAVDDIVNRFHCPIYLHPSDLSLVDPATASLHAFAIPLTSPITPMGNTIDVDGFHMEVMETPGHTMGSVCIFVEDVIFSGDTLFYQSIGRTDLHESDPALMRQSLKKLAALQKDYHVLPGHGPATSLNEEKKYNYYLMHISSF